MTDRVDVELIRQRGIDVDELIAKLIDAAMQAGIDLPLTSLQRGCITCASQVIEGKYDQSAALRYFDEDAAAPFILLCTATPQSDMRNRAHKKSDFRKKHNLLASKG